MNNEVLKEIEVYINKIKSLLEANLTTKQEQLVGELATQKQISYLKDLGVTSIPSNLTKSGANDLIKSIKQK